jgi:DNA-binding transcriptional ArsR family regulator
MFREMCYNPAMTELEQPLIDMAGAFKALGDPTRLKIFAFLCRQCCPVALGENGDVRPVSGPTVGEVCCHVTGAERINSTISHHLKELRLAGLVTVERRGKNMICGVKRNAVAGLAAYLTGMISDGIGSACCDE